jgi:hypothetical protein
LIRPRQVDGVSLTAWDLAGAVDGKPCAGAAAQFSAQIINFLVNFPDA